MRTFLWGEEDFLLWQNVQLKKNKFSKEESKAPIVEFDLEENFDKSKIREALNQGGGFFSNKKLFIAGNLFNITLGQQAELLYLLSKSNKQKEIEIILFQKGGLTKFKKSKLYCFLMENYKITEFKKINLPELRKWLINEISRLSNDAVQIEEKGISLLLGLSQGNLWQLSNEIKKLINFVSGKKIIKEKDVEAISYGNIEYKIFDLVDAIGQKNKKRALILISSLLKQKLNEFYIFTMIVYQIRNLAKLYNYKNQNYQIVSKKTNLHPFVVKKTQNQLRNFSTREIKKMYEVAAKFDFDLKTGEISPEKALYDLAVSL